ncbi:hypothetical protein BGZ97_001922 [Linnemannia gamsii]|uniref:Uncharacterized protein n=1 Tax=Linnemannia gamsii TaxID=64522 RepID=A0A9P6UIW0_9FUNG|nr:hypothetical protein BGZ97_001922 [Linnemannia gamsii]
MSRLYLHQMVRARWGSLAFQNLCHSGLEPDSGRDDEEFSGGSESEEGKGESGAKGHHGFARVKMNQGTDPLCEDVSILSNSRSCKVLKKAVYEQEVSASLRYTDASTEMNAAVFNTVGNPLWIPPFRHIHAAAREWSYSPRLPCPRVRQTSAVVAQNPTTGRQIV